MVKTLPLLQLLSLLLFFTIHASSHECIHDKIQHDLKVNDPEYEMYDVLNGRVLQTYQNIRILIDTSNLSGVSDAYKSYIMDSLMPPVTNYLQAALQVPKRRTKLKAGGYSTLCSGSIKIPSSYNTAGVDADLIIFVTASNDPKLSYVASAISCLLDTSTYRPIIGKITYNLAQVAIAESDAQREQDIVTSLHELTHVLGFSSSLYAYYRDPSTGKALKGHYYTKSIMGYTATVLSLDPLNQRLANHFNCPTVEGAYLENQGGSGSAGSHFERRVFYNEYMTSSAILDTRISEFALALLEGTGWYQVNYDMAEPITWGKNKGCSFIEGDCVNKVTKKSNFEEFCSPYLSRSCSWTQRAGASCGGFSRTTSSSLPSAINWWGNNTATQDAYSDNCPIMMTYKNLDCEDSVNQYSSTLDVETYAYGSKCFMSTLYQGARLSSPFPYCFKTKCKKDSKGKFFIEVGIGSVTAKCTSAKSITVSGYTGSLVCPDPESFCGQITSEGYCRRGCSARGSCIDQECVCVDGWTGFDCSYKTYTDNSDLCQSNPLQTTRYGDSCTCNPANTSCMCLSGLKTGTECAIYFPEPESEDEPIMNPEEEEVIEIGENDVSDPSSSSPDTSSSSGNNGNSSDDNGNSTGDNGNSTTNTGNSSTGTEDPSTTTTTTATEQTDPSTTSPDTDLTNSTSSTDPKGDSTNLNQTTLTNKTNTTISEMKSGGTLTQNVDQNDMAEKHSHSNIVIIAALSGALGGALIVLGVIFLLRWSRKMNRNRDRRTTKEFKKPPRLTIPIKILDDASNTSSAQHSPELSNTHSLRSMQDSPILRGYGSPSKARIVGHSRFRNYSPEVRDRRHVEDEHQGFGLVLKPVEVENSEFGDAENPKTDVEPMTPELIKIKSVPIVPQEVKIEDHHHVDVESHHNVENQEE